MKAKTPLTISGWLVPILIICLLAVTFFIYSAQEIDKKDILKQQYRIGKNLPPATKIKAMDAVKAFENQISSAEGNVFIPQMVTEIIQNQFENIPPPEVDILSFHALCQATIDLEDDIRLITTEIEAMNLAKQKLNELIDSFNEWIEEKTKTSFQSTERESTEVSEEELPPVLKEHESMKKTPNFNTEYPRSPEIIYSRDPEEMSLPELETELNRIKTAINSFHRISETGVLVLQKQLDRRSEFLQTLSVMVRRVSDIREDLIRNIK